MILKDGTYNFLKWVCLIALPAIITFASVVLPVCGVDAETTKAVTTILAAVATLIGSLIGVSNMNYYKENSDDGN